MIIAVDGIDGAGKTVFADALAEVFAEGGSAVFRASIDDFHRPRVERYARGRRSPEGFYRDSFDYSTFRRVLIDPFREGGQTGASTGFQLAAFDLERDTAVEAAWTTAPRDAVLIVDGVFLHRPELRGLWNWSVWLDVPVDVAFQRMALRDGTDPSPSAPSNARYRDGQELYLKEAAAAHRGRRDRRQHRSRAPAPGLRGLLLMVAPGVLLVDKPGGMTSHDVVARARKALGTRKIGHAGTLDPMATGLLILGVEAATRLLTFIVGLDKTYEATIRLGATTDTDDADGEIETVTDAAAVDPAEITAAIADLTGEISQVPSRVSAIKVGAGAHTTSRARGRRSSSRREASRSRGSRWSTCGAPTASSTSTWWWTAPAARTSERSRGISVRRSASAGTSPRFAARASVRSVSTVQHPSTISAPPPCVHRPRWAPSSWALSRCRPTRPATSATASDSSERRRGSIGYRPPRSTPRARWSGSWSAAATT